MSVKIANAFDFAHVRGSGVVGKDLLMRRSDYRAPYELAPIESDEITVLCNRSREAAALRLFQPSNMCL